MACIGKIGGNLTLPCGAPNPSDMGSPISAKLINASDIASFTVIGGVATITRVAGAVGYNVTAVNNALTVTVGLKSQDIMPGAYDVSVTFKNFSMLVNTTSTEPMRVVDLMARAELVIAVEHVSGKVKVYGLGAPLVCTELVGDSTASDYFTYTYGVEDWQVGTTIHNMAKEDYDALSTPYTPQVP
jgi:hypothetical protein